MSRTYEEYIQNQQERLFASMVAVALNEMLIDNMGEHPTDENIRTMLADVELLVAQVMRVMKEPKPS